MAPTYTKRKRSELQRALRKTKEEDLLRKAEMLSASPDPNSIFSNNTIRKTTPFGVLVLFGNYNDQENEMPGGTCCGNLVEIERLIGNLQAYPHVGSDFFEEKRQAFLREMKNLKHLSASNQNSDKERHRLETEVRNADIQKAWLEKENTDRLQRIQTIEEEIRKTETKIRNVRAGHNSSEAIEAAVAQTKPLKRDIYDDTQRLKRLSFDLESLRKERAHIDSSLTPTMARLSMKEEERLAQEQNTLTSRLRVTIGKLKELEEKISLLKESGETSEDETELTASLKRSRETLAQARNELDGGTKMIDNLDLRVQIIGGRLKALEDTQNSLPEEKENARIAALARAEELLNAWISSSSTLHRILQVDGVSARDLVEALFFANGPMCASGTGACSYLDAADITLDTLMLCNTEEEHAGFCHVEVFD